MVTDGHTYRGTMLVVKLLLQLKITPAPLFHGLTTCLVYPNWLLTCNLEMSMFAGDTSIAVTGSTPVVSAVFLLLTLLSTQEEQAIVRQ